MTELSGGFDFEAVHLFQSKDDPQTFYYVPGEPTPERSESGQPLVNLLISEQTGLVQLSTRWEVKTEQLEALRRPLHDRFPEVDPAAIRFSPAPISIEAVALMLMADDDQEEEVQSVTSSGFPPYTALFNATLNAAQKPRVVAALKGHTGLLKVVYRSSLASELRTGTSVVGEVSADVAELKPDAPISECQSRIETALSEGRLRLERTGSDAAPAELKEKAERMAKAKAAEMLSRLTGKEPDATLDAANLEASVSLTTTVAVPLVRSTDVGSWYPAGAGTANIMIAPSQISLPAEGRPASALVRLAFEMKDVPVAFVQVKWDDEAEIRPPVFSPVTLKGRTDQPLAVKTFYANDGLPYETQLPAPATNELKLNPQDLGLALITADCSSLRRAGAKQAELRINYKPSGNGSADEHLTRFHFGDWTDSWYVVTRSSDLGGVLEVEWSEVDGEGSVSKHPAITTNETAIKL